LIRVVNIEDHGVNHEARILIESVEDLTIYYEKFRKRQIFDATDELRKKGGCGKLRLAGFADADFFIKCGYRDDIKAIRLFANTIGEVYKSQLKCILDGKRIAVNLIGGYFPLSKDAKITEIDSTTHPVFKPKSLLDTVFDINN
jgi:hypothetical protein